VQIFTLQHSLLYRVSQKINKTRVEMTVNKVYYGVGAVNSGKHSISHPPRANGRAAPEQAATHPM
jgi:hypothetical protein